MQERPARTLARSDDPTTSEEAAEEIQDHLPRLQKWALDCVKESPGKTQRELGALYCPEDLRRIGRRLNEAVEAGRIRTGDKRACSITGKRAMTYWPIKR